MIRVTGASGFIGQAVLDYCKGRSLPVVGYTRSSSSSKSALVFVSDYTAVPGDGVLIHLGEHNNISTITTELIEQQLKVSEQLAKKPFQKIVYASSAAVYGPSEDVIKVTSVDYSESIYAQSKLKSENYFLASGNTAVRLSNVFGFKMAQNNVLTTVLRQRNQPLIEVQNVKPIRDYVWSEDVARAMVELALSQHQGIFHVSTGIGSSVADIISMVCEISGNNNYQVRETKPGYGNKIVLDSSETTQKLGWRPQTTLHSGLANLIGCL